MAAIQFSTMVTRVGELINQSVSDDTLTVTNTEVKANINIGYTRCVNAIVSANEDYFLQEATADLVASQQSYSLPTDCRKLKRLELAYDANNPTIYYKADLLDIHSWASPTSGTNGVANPVYAIIGEGYRLNPTPTANVTGGIRLFYIKDQSNLVNNTDIPAIPLGFHHLPIMYAVAKAKERLGMLDEARIAMAEFEMGVVEMVEDITSRTGDDVSFVEVSDLMPEY